MDSSIVMIIPYLSRLFVTLDNISGTVFLGEFFGFKSYFQD